MSVQINTLDNGDVEVKTIYFDGEGDATLTRRYRYLKGYVWEVFSNGAMTEVCEGFRSRGYFMTIQEGESLEDVVRRHIAAPFNVKKDPILVVSLPNGKRVAIDTREFAFTERFVRLVGSLNTHKEFHTPSWEYAANYELIDSIEDAEKCGVLIEPKNR